MRNFLMIAVVLMGCTDDPHDLGTCTDQSLAGGHDGETCEAACVEYVPPGGPSCSATMTVGDEQREAFCVYTFETSGTRGCCIDVIDEPLVAFAECQ